MHGFSFLRRTLPSGVLLVSVPLLLGWFHVLSKDAYFSANPHVEAAEVRVDPGRFSGTTLLLAGQIVERTTEGGTRLEILCYSRDEADRPVDLDPECGRLLVLSPRLLAEELGAGRLVTLAGTVTGEKSGEMPVFSLVEIHPWPQPGEAPRRPYYYPAPYPYPGRWCDPWYDPFCDPFYPHSYWGARFGWRW